MSCSLFFSNSGHIESTIYNNCFCAHRVGVSVLLILPGWILRNLATLHRYTRLHSCVAYSACMKGDGRYTGGVLIFIKITKAGEGLVPETNKIRIKTAASAQHTGSYIVPTWPLSQLCRMHVGGELQYENECVRRCVCICVCVVGINLAAQTVKP